MKRNAEFKRLYGICREHWNEYDPIGVRVNLGNDSQPDWFPDDEYDRYVAHTVALVMEGADAVKIRKHIEHCCTVDMGLSPTRKTDEVLKTFVEELLNLRKP